jgi:hypothetical protein
MKLVGRREALVGLIAALVLVAAAVAGAFAGLGRAGGTRAHTPTPYLRHPEFALKALLLAKAAGIQVTPAARAAARAQSLRPRLLWRGASTRFSVFRRSAAPSQVPVEVRRFVAWAADASHISNETALARLKLLRSGVGSVRGSLYAFIGGAGEPCLFLTHYGGTCGAAGSNASAWVIGGGGQNGNPDILVGLAPDDVTRVTLTVDGRSVPVSLNQNVIYAQFATGGTSAEIATTRVDGTVTSDRVGLKGH